MTRLVPIVALFGCLVAAAWAAPAHAAEPAGLAVLAPTPDRVPDLAGADRGTWLRCGGGSLESLAPYATPRRKDWHFHVAPYGWLAGNAGEVVTNGETTDLDLSFEDLFERANGGFQLYAEVRYKRLFVAFDGTWAQLGDSYDGRLFRVAFEVDQRIFDMRLGFEVLRCSPDGALSPTCEPWRRWVVADVFVGARYWYTDVSVTLTGPLGGETAVGDTSERVDPFIGARIGWDISRRLGLGVRGDVGGFGIGDAAQLAWQAQVTMGYRLTRVMTVLLGYRLLASDTITGSGTGRNGQDLVQQGPIVGLGFSF